MSIPSQLESALTQSHVNFSPLVHLPTYGTQYAAAMMHVSGNDVAKSVVLRTAKTYFLVVLPAPYRIDFEKLAEIVGGGVYLVDEEECNKLFPDCEAGAIPAFGELYQLPVYLDSSLAHDLHLVLNAGTRADAIRMTSGDFIRMVKPKVCSFAEKL
jgi:Ala-tRNA(Pro) deacylase